jgi:hypothetical protein
MSEEPTNPPIERRSEPRKITDLYYSVEFLLKELNTVYQFKIWDISASGMCVLVKEGSAVLEHLNVGDIVVMTYYPAEKRTPVTQFRTEIRHISQDKQGRFKGHYLVGLAIIEGQPNSIMA